MKRNKIHFETNIYANFLFIIIILIFPGSINSQYLAGRYLDDVFQYEITSIDIAFSTNVPEPEPAFTFCGLFSGYILNVNENVVNNRTLKMNIYEPQNDGITQRPVIIICFGGGFVGGSKNEQSMKWLAEGFAKRGYVAALIDYRLGMKVADPYLSQRSVYRGIQDGRAAVRFFRADASNANNYKIDPDQIYIGGHSAGAFIAIHNGYLDKSSERPAAATDNAYPLLGGLDEAGQNTTFNGKANAIFGLAGALGDLEWMESSSDLPIIMFHDVNDPTVSSTIGMPFLEYQAICNINLPEVFGSEEIAQKAFSLDIPYELYLYNNRGHSVHDSAGIRLYGDIIPKISSFFYTQKLKPEISPILGKDVLCIGSSTSDYSILNPELTYVQWDISGGQITDSDSNNKNIEVTWDENVADHSIACRGFNKNGAQSNEISMDVEIITSGTNTFLFANSDWTNLINWSQAHLPLTCEHVEIPSGNSVFDLILPGHQEIVLKSLSLGNQINLTIPSSSLLRISE